MNEVEERLRENYPPILMTLVSFIVALTFENLVNGMTSRDEIWAPTASNLFLWSQNAFLGLGALMFWFTLSLHSAALRTVFSPRDAFTAVSGGMIFILLAANVGPENALGWMAAGAAVFSVAFFGWRDFGLLYAADPAISGDTHTHRSSRWIVLGSGSSLAVATLLYHLGVLGVGGAGVALLLAVGGAFIAHLYWYAEWKDAVGMRHHE